MFCCPLCRNETIIISKLCEKCDRIRHLIQIYSLDEVIGVIEEKLVVGNGEYKIKIGGDLHIPKVEVSDVEIKPNLTTSTITNEYQLRSKRTSSE
jgi:hypothetical protein